MDQEDIVQYVADTFAGVDILRPTDGPGAGDTFFIYDPERNLDDKRRFPFATIVTKNYVDWDEQSQLDRAGVYRLNVGVSQETFRRVFDGSDGHVDYAELDRLMPHPTYASQGWISVLNPQRDTFERVKPLLEEAYRNAVRRIERKA